MNWIPQGKKSFVENNFAENVLADLSQFLKFNSSLIEIGIHHIWSIRKNEFKNCNLLLV
jgi:hypothetical protein